ncbi:DUF2164 domain-containing protein [Alkalimarinus coralli]|uniref:DUF2164 domain-containing protein n=1 Tax=Alkalimarinus coralli TaxID=2935863 RepID=UPI00202B2C37|nr:DUF2164 domain-containing protein [Alkalimarinus coralli]
MPEIKFSKEEKHHLINKVQRYFQDELDHEIGQFEADFLLDFFAKELGAFYYNQGLRDAQTVLVSKLDTISDAIYEIEQPTSF